MKKRYIILATMLAATITLADDFSGTLLVRPTWTHSVTGITTVSEQIPVLLSWTHATGTNANQMTQLWRSRQSLVASGTNSHNIAGGITNAFGEALTITTVRFFAVVVDDAQGNGVEVGGAATQPFSAWAGDATDTVLVIPGGLFMTVAPTKAAFAVSTNSYIQVKNSGTNAISYDVWVGGSNP